MLKLLSKLKYVVDRIKVMATTDLHVLSNNLNYRSRRASAILKYSPLGVTIWISDKCNLNCFFCLRNRDESRLAPKHEILDDMTFRTFIRILNKFRAAEYVGIIGQGEPLLNKDALRMFKLAVRKNRKVRLVTNGVLIDEKLAKEIIELGLYEITVSLKAISAAEYEKVTGKGGGDAFDKVCNALRYLVKYKNQLHADTIIAINFTLYKSILDQAHDVVRVAETLGIDTLRFNNYIPFGDRHGSDTAEVLFESDVEAVKIIDKLKECASPVNIILPKLIRSNKFTGNCSSCFRGISVDARGDVTFCDRVLPPSGKMGNVFSDNDVWNCDYIVKFRERLLYRKDDLPERCKLCVEMSTDWPK